MDYPLSRIDLWTMGTGKTVLAAITDRQVIDSLEPLFSRHSVEFNQVANGEACLVLASSARYDLVLAQLPLIDMSATRLISGLRSGGSSCEQSPILLLGSDSQARAANVLKRLDVESIVLSDSVDAFRRAVAGALGVPVRASTRVLVNLHVDLDNFVTTHVYETENLSRTGMLVRTGHPLPVGTEFAFDLCLDEPQAVLQGVGQVVRHTARAHENTCGMGIHFKQLDDAATSDLDFFVRDRLRRRT